MPKRKCIFNQKLEKMYPFLMKDKDDSHLSCTKCGGHFSMASRGRGDIVVHIQSKKHQKYMGVPSPSERVDSSYVAKKKKIRRVQDIEMCRICRNSANVSSATNLFKDEHCLLTQIKNLTGCLLTNEADLPKFICRDCEENLKRAHDFRERCLDSQLYFSSANYKEQILMRPNENCDEDEVEVEEQVEKPQEIEKVLVAIKEETNFAYDNETDMLEVNNEAIVKDELVLNEEVEDYAHIGREVIMGTDVITMSKSNTTEGENKGICIGSGIKEKADLICDRCGNHFTSRQHFKTHLRRHTNNKPFKCEVCPKQCYTPSELKHHMRRHTGERPFACQYCERRFTDYSTRVRHERTHTNERPYACSQCGKAFTRANLLRKHLLVHTGERPFKCTECNKAFQTRTSLTVHYRSILHKQMVEKRRNSTDFAHNAEIRSA